MRSGEMPDDVGLLPDTIIKPVGANLPSYFAAFGNRLRMDRQRIRMRVTEFLR